MNLGLPSLHGLRAFEAAARHLSFTRAAAELHVTQTAVSHLIRRLEEELGTRLFLRRPRAIELTEAGQRLLPLVGGAFEDLRRAVERVRVDANRRHITLSTTPGFAVKWLVPRLTRFRERHPDVEIRLQTDMRLVDFRRDEVDLAVRFGRGGWPDVEAHYLMAEHIFPVCAPALLAGDPPLREPADLARHRLIAIGALREDWTLWFTAAGLPDPGSQQVLGFDTALEAIEAAIDGQGVILGRELLVATELARGRLVVPFRVTIPAAAGYYLVVPKGGLDRPIVRAFRHWIIETAKATPGIDPRA